MSNRRGGGRPPAAHDRLKLTKARWADLPGWADDKHAEAVPAFIVSCVKLAELADTDPVGADGHGGFAKQWRRACDKAGKLTQGDHKAARDFFESEFVPYEAAGKAGPVGKLTGYFVQEIHASRKRGGKYQIPILSRPPDLVMIELAQFIRDAQTAGSGAVTTTRATSSPTSRATRSAKACSPSTGSRSCTPTIRSTCCSLTSRAPRRP